MEDSTKKPSLVKITFPDKTSKEYKMGITPAEIAAELGPRLAESALVAEVNSKLVDLSTPITEDAKLRILTFEDEEGKEVFMHSAAHVLASAVVKLFPDAKPTIGPSVEEGFYYDFWKKEPFTPEDIDKIEREMKRIVEADYPFVRKEVSKSEAEALFKENKFKLELLKEFDKISLYTHDDFTDLCRGPHVPSTGKIKAFKLTKISGSYWRGDATKEQLQRIYGIAFPEKKQLDEYLNMIKEAEKRDHRKLGKELDLFSFHDEGPGFPFFHPKGMIILNTLVDFWREEHRKAGYKEIRTPIVLAKKLWEQSGHWEHYRENMYFTKIDDIDYAIKPMNCPGGILVYKNSKHSYKELPLRMAELGIVHRHELSGVLSGLFRVRCFTQDDAHIFCTPEQLTDEILGVVDLTERFYKLFGFEYHVELSTTPEKSMLTPEMRERAETALKEALKKRNINYIVNEGEGAFYGPKIDFHIKDCIGRTWQCGTVQVDFSMPEKFDLRYMGPDGTENHRPIMVHRVIYGSLERFLGILVEHYAGKFPLWLSPEQVRILTVSDKFEAYADRIRELYFNAGMRVDVDKRAESVNRKVREAQLDKVSYIIVVGEREEKQGTVTVRSRNNEIIGTFKAEEFLEMLKKEIAKKK